MIQMLQPISGLVLGLALSVLGLFHSMRTFPTSPTWQQVGRFLPQLGSVLLFAACMLVLLAGVALLIRGIRGTRHRLRQLRHIRWNAEREYDENPRAWR